MSNKLKVITVANAVCALVCLGITVPLLVPAIFNPTVDDSYTGLGFLPGLPKIVILVSATIGFFIFSKSNPKIRKLGTILLIFLGITVVVVSLFN